MHSKITKSLLSILCLMAFSNLKAQSLVKEGAKLTLISDQFAFTEGPAADKKGNVYFTDQPNDKIWKYSTNGDLSLYMDGTGRANGLFFDKAGNLIACADNDNELWKIDKNKNVEVLTKNWDGKRLNAPNDLWIDAKGGIYFSDPFYKRDYWKHTESEQEEQRVYYRNPAGKVSIAADGFVRPNGLIGDKMLSKMYITDIGDKKTYVYDMAADGSLNNKKLFCEQGSDGMTLDQKSNVYLVGKGVTIYSPEGKVIEKIDVPEGWTANITFGGKKNKTLFITASKSLYTIEMNVKGAK
ncbi:SMP-30/gluconolactonase/LRE family protein [Arcticibacterium luteifluviistationis]|uniref:Gluconolactonase n=1 Tax=Arcticibacterium luteifluviistationis TaxID=1784714 RepID=A0A2Z4G9Z5_9BACT|nr:SMP-30/gluconolactonase/LRE family protein [Arcticibacterium luteifluviistationis]AWV98059.1 gluconolactonase [Arcticibacterium luteifluviistationis]